MKKLVHKLLKPMKMFYYRYTWRKKNSHNDTVAINSFCQDHVTVGNKTYGPIEILYDNGLGKLSIGNYCSIAREVKFFLGGEHDYRRISTYPFQTLTYSVKMGGQIIEYRSRR